ncbi:MAG: 4'-phosphopantetheinyl transferase superfamily protein [Eubacterium sp.]|nr:4'-phosphopantetheinyl transferase superfamily protein [Eubacterium sp.]
MFNLYYLKISEEHFSKADTELMKHVSDKRRSKIERFKFDKDKKLSLYAALLTKMQLSCLTGMSPSELEFSISESGKPVLLNSNISFNFSHTEGMVLLAVSDNSSVGADVEKVTDPRLSVMKKIFHPAEISYVNIASEDETASRFYEIWTKKEAYGKFLGKGLFSDIQNINSLSLSHNFISTNKYGYILTAYTEDISNSAFFEVSIEEIRNYFPNPKD